jgi:acyl-CoA synthetase (NDP forming)
MKSPASLDCLFRPSSVAVIGASRKRGNVGGTIFHNLISHSFPGAVYPVNPTASVVQSVRAYPSVLDIPDPIDLAVIVVRSDQVLRVVDQCAEKGVRGIVVISAGTSDALITCTPGSRSFSVSPREARSSLMTLTVALFLSISSKGLNSPAFR